MIREKRWKKPSGPCWFIETRSQEPHVPMIQPLVDSWPAPSSVNHSPDSIRLVTIRGAQSAASELTLVRLPAIL
jgi:hypothetical protein